MNEWDAWPCVSALVATLATVAARFASKRSKTATGLGAWAWRSGVALATPLAVLGLATSGVGFWYTHRPQPAPESRKLFQGVSYAREVRQSPRPQVIHVVRVDLAAKGLRFFVTPDEPAAGRMLRARATSEFLNEFGLPGTITRDPATRSTSSGSPPRTVGSTRQSPGPTRRSISPTPTPSASSHPPGQSGTRSTVTAS
jgi:hypothetical protein